MWPTHKRSGCSVTLIDEVVSTSTNSCSAPLPAPTIDVERPSLALSRSHR